jgi:hypothetical protein
MSKVLLLSIMIAIIALPARAANLANSRQGMRKAIIWMLFFELFYVFALMFLIGRI